MRRLSLGLGGVLVVGAVVVLMAPAAVALADSDGDLVDDAVDNCPAVANPFQADQDFDGVGDLCEPDVASEATAGADLLVGSDGDDEIDGLAGDDSIHGGAGDDTLVGSEDDDFLSGGPGSDTLTGGPGCDIFAIDPTDPDPDTVTDFTPGEDRFAFARQDDDPTDDELPEATFDPEAEHLTATFADGGEVNFEGLDPDAAFELDTSPCAAPAPVEPAGPTDPCLLLTSVLQAPPGTTGLSPYAGTTGSDHITGTTGTDHITGEPGDGFTDGFGQVDEGGHDCIYGGDDDDHLYGEVFNGIVIIGGNDYLYGGAGNDSLFGENHFGAVETGGDDTLHGGAGSDSLYGDSLFDDVFTGGNDTLYGGDDMSPDYLYGDSAGGIVFTGGNDTLNGGGGNDWLFGDSASGTVDFGGNDTLEGGDGGDEIHGDSRTGVVDFGGDDTLEGGAGADRLYGETREGFTLDGGHDTLTGGTGADWLYGDTSSGLVITGGNDTLEGGDGMDALYGDSATGIVAIGGDDTLTGGPGDDSLTGDTLTGALTIGGEDTFVFDTATDFGDDTVFDPGAGSTEDIALFQNVGGTGTLADLEAVSTTTDGGLGGDVVVTMDDDGSSVTFKGLGTTGNTIDTITELDATAEIDVQTTA